MRDWNKMMQIDSAGNSKFKTAKSLLTKKGRSKQSKFLVEGLRNIERAIFYHYPLDIIFVREDQKTNTEIRKLIQEIEEKVVLLSVKLFDQLSDTVNSQGILAVAPILHKSFDGENEEIVLVLDKIQDPGNFGSLIRTADSAGIRSIFYTEGTVDVYSPKVVRAAMGSIFYMNFYKINDLDGLKAKEYCIIASTLGTDCLYEDMNPYPKTVLILGNEANGISREFLEQADVLVKIPIYGKAESLNVAAAGAILMYKLKELSRNKKSKGA